MQLDELEKRVKILEDMDQIQKLQVRYVNMLTIADWPGVYDCFSDDAVIDFPQGVWSGRDGVRAVFQDLVSQMHVGLEGNFVVHPIVTVDGDKAKGSWLLYIQFARPRDLPKDFTDQIGGEAPDWMQGYYEMEYIRMNGEWKISHLRWRRRLLSPLPLSER
jgi:ketosteroid isomerase-like protein